MGVCNCQVYQKTLASIRLSREPDVSGILAKVDELLSEATRKHRSSVEMTKQTSFEVCLAGSKAPVPPQWREALGTSSVCVLADFSQDTVLEEKLLETIGSMSLLAVDQVMVFVCPANPEAAIDAERAITKFVCGRYRRLAVRLQFPCPWASSVCALPVLIFAGDGTEGLQGRHAGIDHVINRQ